MVATMRSGRSRNIISALLTISTVTGCSTRGVLDTFDLTVQPSIMSTMLTKNHKNIQFLVATPTALKAFDGENIVIRSTPVEIAYLKGAQWADRLPNIVQSRLVQAFENTRGLGGVGRPGDGLTVNYHIISDIHAFNVETYTSRQVAVVEIAAKLLNDKNGEVRSTRLFRAAENVSETGNVAYVQALNAAFNSVTRDIVNWALANI